MHYLRAFSFERSLRFTLPVVLGLLLWAVSPIFLVSHAGAFDGTNPPVPTTQLNAMLSGPPIGGVLPFGFGSYAAFDDGRRHLGVFVNQVNLPPGDNTWGQSGNRGCGPDHAEHDAFRSADVGHDARRYGSDGIARHARGCL